MKMLKAGLLGCSILIGVATQAFAEKKFEGVHLKMLACADTSVTRLVKILDEFKNATGANVTVDLYPYPGLIDKIVVETSRRRRAINCYGSTVPGWGNSAKRARYWLSTTSRSGTPKRWVWPISCPSSFRRIHGKASYTPSRPPGWSGACSTARTCSGISEEMAAFKAKYGYDLAPAKTYKQYYDIAQFFTRKKGEKLAGQVLDKDFYGTAQAYSRVGCDHPRLFRHHAWLWGRFLEVLRPTDAMNGPAQDRAAAEYMKSLIPFNPPDWGGLVGPAHRIHGTRRGRQISLLERSHRPPREPQGGQGRRQGRLFRRPDIRRPA